MLALQVILSDSHLPEVVPPPSKEGLQFNNKEHVLLTSPRFIDLLIDIWTLNMIIACYSGKSLDYLIIPLKKKPLETTALCFINQQQNYNRNLNCNILLQG